MIKVGIIGGTGKLGRDIIAVLSGQEEIAVGAVVTRRGNSYAGQALDTLVPQADGSIIIRDSISEAAEFSDLFIDCTSARTMMDDNFRSYSLANRPLIVATTGFNAEDLERIAELSAAIPVVMCPNFSIGVYRFLKLVRLAAVEFGMNADIDILESHHKYKKDKPSGTALAIQKAIGSTGVEAPVTIHSVRAGNIIGEHSVMFTTGDNERIELSHKVYSRQGFSQGVISTVKWIADKQPGLFGIADIFG